MSCAAELLVFPSLSLSPAIAVAIKQNNRPSQYVPPGSQPSGSGSDKIRRWISPKDNKRSVAPMTAKLVDSGLLLEVDAFIAKRAAPLETFHCEVDEIPRGPTNPRSTAASSRSAAAPSFDFSLIGFVL